MTKDNIRDKEDLRADERQFVVQRWPQQMDARMAMAYCGERSVGAFRRKIGLGIYPPASLKRPGSREMWHRRVLDKWLARAHGISDSELVSEDVADLI